MPQNERELIEDRLYELFSLATGNRSPGGYPAGEEPQRASYMSGRQWIDLMDKFILPEAGISGPDKASAYIREVTNDIHAWEVSPW